MGQRFYSGAFVQQCFAVHPLCLSLKRIDDEGRLLVACTSCRMVHSLSLDEVIARVAAVPLDGDLIPAAAVTTPKDRLVACLQAHALAVTIRELDVIRDSAGLRCAECRRLFDLRVSAFESHQKS
ncbi:MAG: hypothetical protein NBKEAIPA_02990 [Nitrospirae bacterium]|nr:MAG: hypothetical protein UZ03_NOB001000340 [Nitrospira sp. OLB3]MBV6471063.1 hypothetical protein [Nitrospirota bacterium]MCE7966078.1 hypothetical protein [Nitrospira sp. NTP2]MCK6493627.1 hypothetical protein [Nitrospira sp.]MEB2338967.1 hypothetical protein [Nitrospirales bacterium]